MSQCAVSFVATTVLCAVLQAASIDLSGTVTDMRDRFIQGATVRLVGEGLDTVTDAAGSYSFVKQQSRIRIDHSSKSTGRALRNGRVEIFLPSAARVIVAAFDTRGRLLTATVDRVLPTGPHVLPILTPELSSGLFFLSIRVDEETRVLSCLALEHTVGTTAHARGVGPLRKRAAVIDTLRFSKDGYETVRVPLERLVDTVDVTLTVDPDLSPVGFQPADGFALVFADEFEGTYLDTSEWNYRTGTTSGYHSYQQPENVSVSGSCCRIAKRKQTYGGKEYTGGGVITKRSFVYGYFEARMKIGDALGFHPAFWAACGTGTADDSDCQSQAGKEPRLYEIDGLEHDDFHNDSKVDPGYTVGRPSYNPFAHVHIADSWKKQI